MMMRHSFKWVFLAVSFIVCFSAMAEEQGFYSLGYDKVNLRAGPAERFPIKWVYQEKNYPVEVIDSYENWRKVREADGTLGWVNQKMLKEARYVIVEEEDKLLSSPSLSGKIIAYVQPGVLARIRSCPQGDYCLLQFSYENKKIEGWFPRRFVWGLYENEIIE